MANRIVSVHAGICGIGIYVIMLPSSSGFSVAHWIQNCIPLIFGWSTFYCTVPVAVSFVQHSPDCIGTKFYWQTQFCVSKNYLIMKNLYKILDVFIIIYIVLHLYVISAI